MIFAMHNESHPALRAYLLGLLNLRLGDVASAKALARELAGLAYPQSGLVGSLAAELASAICRAEGSRQEALALLEQSKPRLWFQLTVASPFFSLASRRFLHAELLRELGRPDEAARWYASIAERSPYELIYAEPARQRLAEMAAAATLTH
jgi:hypothetical protein